VLLALDKIIQVLARSITPVLLPISYEASLRSLDDAVTVLISPFWLVEFLFYLLVCQIVSVLLAGKISLAFCQLN